MEFQVRDEAGQILVSYDCPCGCTPTAALAQGGQHPGSEHCCCGRVHFVGPHAKDALDVYLAERRARGEDEGTVWHFGETTINTEEQTAVPVAYAIPEHELYREGAPAPAHTTQGEAQMNELTLTAPDISCDHCINAIRKAVSALPEVEFVAGSPETKQVVIRYNPEATSLGAITEAMEEEGYPVKL
jgi:copper chaperone